MTTPSPTPPPPPAELQAGFLAILPRVRTHAAIFFRHLPCPGRKEDAIAETVAVAWKWYCRLAERGKDGGDFPAALASLAARAVKSGRRLCGQEASKDVLSPLAQQRHGFVVGKLAEVATQSSNPLNEALIDNTRSPVDEQVVFRLDFPAWLAGLGDRNRHLAQDMALGHRTRELADIYGTTPGRVSQLRRQFQQDWERFCNEGSEGQPQTVA